MGLCSSWHTQAFMRISLDIIQTTTKMETPYRIFTVITVQCLCTAHSLEIWIINIAHTKHAAKWLLMKTQLTSASHRSDLPLSTQQGRRRRSIRHTRTGPTWALSYRAIQPCDTTLISQAQMATNYKSNQLRPIATRNPTYISTIIILTTTVRIKTTTPHANSYLWQSRYIDSPCATHTTDWSFFVRVCAHTLLRTNRPSYRATLIGSTIPNMRDSLPQFSASLTIATHQSRRGIHYFVARWLVLGQIQSFQNWGKPKICIARNIRHVLLAR